MVKHNFIRIISVFFFAFILMAENALAQSDTMPHFSMVLVNGDKFTYKDVPLNKPVIIIYFAPDCEHCQKLLNNVFKKIKDFKRAELILITFKPMADVKAFVQQYQTSRYSNVIVGTEGNTYFIRYYYNLSKTPFTALFNRKRKLVISYRDQTPVEGLIMQLHKIN